jgi:DNA adenine methylase
MRIYANRGVCRNRPHLVNNGQGVNRPQIREPGVLSDSPDSEFHPMTMPELIRWFQWLSARLRHVRIVHGDWKRVSTKSAVATITVRYGKAMAGIFFDPPYSTKAGRDNNIYFVESQSIAHDVREWCKKWGDYPKYRIVLAGYDNEHVELESYGWRAYEWFRPGFMKGGMGKTKRTNSSAPGGQQHRERLWASPHCLIPPGDAKANQKSIFD